MPSAVDASAARQTKRPPPVPLSAMHLLAPNALLEAHLISAAQLRPSGRRVSQAQHSELNIGSLTHCNGSSVVKIGHTTIICGIRGEILPVSEIPSYNASDISRAVNAAGNTHQADGHYNPLALYNLVVPNIDLSTGCSPAHAMNTAPTASTQSLTQRLYSLLLSTHTLSASDLEIKYTPPPEANHGLDPDDPAYVVEAGVEQIKAYWVLYIDMVCISYGSAGAVFDAAWLAMQAALNDTLLPKAWWNADDGVVLCDSDVSKATRLRIDTLHVSLNFGIFEGLKNTNTADKTWTLIDLDAFEEECCSERGCVVISASKNSQIVKIEKNGGPVLGTEGIKEVLRIARERGVEWKHKLDTALETSHR